MSEENDVKRENSEEISRKRVVVLSNQEFSGYIAAYILESEMTDEERANVVSENGNVNLLNLKNKYTEGKNEDYSKITSYIESRDGNEPVKDESIAGRITRTFEDEKAKENFTIQAAQAIHDKITISMLPEENKGVFSSVDKMTLKRSIRNASEELSRTLGILGIKIDAKKFDLASPMLSHALEFVEKDGTTPGTFDIDAVSKIFEAQADEIAGQERAKAAEQARLAAMAEFVKAKAIDEKNKQPLEKATVNIKDNIQKKEKPQAQEEREVDDEDEVRG